MLVCSGLLICRSRGAGSPESPTSTPRQPRVVGRAAFFQRRSEYKERPRAIVERQQQTPGFYSFFGDGEYKESPWALWSVP